MATPSKAEQEAESRQRTETGIDPGETAAATATIDDVAGADPAPARAAAEAEPAPQPAPPPVKENDVKYIICSPAAGQPTWLIGGNWKIQLDTPEDVAAWEAAGAISVAVSQQFVNSVPTL